MRAARERMRGALSVSTKKDDSKKKIQTTTEPDFARVYKLGKNVMESTNTGMDVLYAKRLADNHDVVIKRRMRSNSFKSTQEEREWRMTTEYQLNMPKVDTLCQFYEVLETRENYYVVMEKVGGQDLFEQISSTKLSHVDSREIVKQILSALAAMHVGGRIHKDLKIENVMVDMDGNTTKMEDPCSPAIAKLIDFDTVQDWEPCSPKCKDVLGTDGYIAPEAYSGDYSPASDVYAAGVIAYKLLTGRFPSKPEIFDDLPGENWVGSPSMSRIKKRLQDEQIDFTVRPLDRCQEAADICARMLAFEAEARPSAEQCLNHGWFMLEPARLPNR